MKDRYWFTMIDKKYTIYYLSKYFEESVKINRVIKIIGAVASCSSIAAWTIWKEYAFVWGAIIALSQVISAINEFLPYQRRVEDISNLKTEFEKLYLEYEEKWYPISKGLMPDEEINNYLFELENKWHDIDSKYFTDDILSHNSKCEKFAQNQTDNYFKDKFGSC